MKFSENSFPFVNSLIHTSFSLKSVLSERHVAASTLLDHCLSMESTRATSFFFCLPGYNPASFGPIPDHCIRNCCCCFKMDAMSLCFKVVASINDRLSCSERLILAKIPWCSTFPRRPCRSTSFISVTFLSYCRNKLSTREKISASRSASPARNWTIWRRRESIGVKDEKASPVSFFTFSERRWTSANILSFCSFSFPICSESSFIFPSNSAICVTCVSIIPRSRWRTSSLPCKSDIVVR